LTTPCDAQITQNDTTICFGDSVELSVASAGAIQECSLPANLQNGLVGYWPFCGNAIDASGNGNNGTVNGATLTTDRFGNADNAYSFDGNNDVISLPQSNLWNFGVSDFTLAGWFISNSGTQDNIIRYDNGLGPQNLWGMRVRDQELNFLLQGTNNIGINPSPQTNLGGLVSNSSWHYGLVVRTGTDMLIYVDGDLEYQGSTSQVVNIDAGTVYYPSIGRLGSFSGEYFDGQIDDVGIWNRALSESEIQQLYSSDNSTYTWSTGSADSSITVAPTETTTYTVTVDNGITTCTDSVTVTVNNPTTSTTDATECDSYTWNGTAYTTSGAYTYQTTNAEGCDSTATLNLTISTGTFGPTQSISGCGTATLNGETYTQSGVYTQVLTNALGCDSTITVAVTLDQGINYSQSFEICSGDTVEVGTSAYAVAGDFTDVLIGTNGCDSIVNTNITVNAAPEPVVIADGTTEFCPDENVILSTGVYPTYLWSNGDTTSSITVESSGTYSVTVTWLTNSCQGTSNDVAVTVYPVEIGIITYGSGYLSVTPSTGSNYQWYFNGQSIPGANESTHLPWNTGNYHVEFSDTNDCKVISEIFEYTDTSVMFEDLSNQIRVYPNPSNGLYTMTFEKLSDVVTYSVYDLMGRKIIHDSIAGNGQRVIKSLNLSAFSNGMYSLRLDTESGSLVKRLIKE
jgi:hypothetical protein